MMLKEIISLFQFILGFHDKLRTADLDARDRVADYLEGIGKELLRFTTSFRGSNNPEDDKSMNNASFSALGEHMRNLQHVVSNELGDELAQELSANLREAQRIPTTLRYDVICTTESDRESLLDQLDEMAGKFSATAATVRATNQ